MLDLDKADSYMARKEEARTFSLKAHVRTFTDKSYAAYSEALQLSIDADRRLERMEGASK